MADESDPPRKFYQLKPKEFERVNETPSPATEPTDPQNAPPSLDASAPIHVRELVRQASTGVPLLKGNAPANRETEVHALLRDNLSRANAAGLNDVAPKPKRASRRKRDYIFAMIVGNFALLIGTAIQPIFGAAGLIIFNLGLTWIMWFVMDDY